MSDGRVVSAFRGTGVPRPYARRSGCPWAKLDNAGQSRERKMISPSRHARRFSLRRELICDIKIGPSENSPASAFRVKPRR